MGVAWAVAVAWLAVGVWAVDGYGQLPGDVAFSLRVGAVHSGPVAATEVAVPRDDGARLEAVELRPSVAPVVAASAYTTVASGVAAEVQVGATRARMSGDGPAGAWHAGDLTVVHAHGGLRFRLTPSAHGRIAAGKAFYSGEAAILRDGADTGVLLAAGAGWRPIGGRPFALDVEVQRHDFGTPAFRAVGGTDGSVARVLVTLAFETGGGS